jgi:hypothetical protein
MAALRKTQGDTFIVCFRLNGRQFQRTLKTKDSLGQRFGARACHGRASRRRLRPARPASAGTHRRTTIDGRRHTAVAPPAMPFSITRKRPRPPGSARRVSFTSSSRLTGGWWPLSS